MKCPGHETAGMAGMLTGLCDCHLICRDAVPLKVQRHVLMGDSASVAAVVRLGEVLHIGAALKRLLVTAGVVSGGNAARQHSQGYVKGSQQAAASPAFHGLAQRCRAVSSHKDIDIGMQAWSLSCLKRRSCGPGFRALLIRSAGCLIV